MESTAYGQTRKSRADVSYREIEEVAMAILGTGTRPTVDNVRKHLKGGARRTLLNGLKRFWKELGGRVVGLPDSRRRLPAVVADLADDLWLAALNVATESATGVDSTLRAELSQLRLDQDMRAHALAQRELEIENHLRSRERTLRELEEHLRATMSLVGKRDSTIQALEARLAAALSETETYRRRLATLVAAAQRRSRPAVRGRKVAAPDLGRRPPKKVTRTARRLPRAKSVARPAKRRSSPRS